MAATVFAGGANGRRPWQFGNFGDFATGPTVYVTPGYLLNAARRKYGRHISVIGALESALADFWDTVETKAENFDENQRPKAVSRIVVDITAKEHCNTGTSEDKMEVVTGQEERRSEKKSCSLSFGKQSNWEFGGGLNVGGSFFNTARLYLSEFKGSSQVANQEHKKKVKKKNVAMLSQTYCVKAGDLTVPPKTKVTVEIITYAVTYKLPVKAVISAPSNSYVPFYYKGWLGNLCCAGAGPTFRKFGYIANCS